jgi:hypothetical protein
MAFYVKSKDSFLKSLTSSLPVPIICFTKIQRSTTAALYFGIPIPALWAYVSKHIQSGAHRGGPFIVDAHGQSHLTAQALRGGHIQRNYNGICSTNSDGLREARCPHLGAGTHCTCKGVFRNAFPRVTETMAMKNINDIIPDLVL